MLVYISADGIRIAKLGSTHSRKILSSKSLMPRVFWISPSKIVFSEYHPDKRSGDTYILNLNDGRPHKVANDIYPEYLNLDGSGFYYLKAVNDTKFWFFDLKSRKSKPVHLDEVRSIFSEVSPDGRNELRFIDSKGHDWYQKYEPSQLWVDRIK
jgi:hypothetical protein